MLHGGKAVLALMALMFLLVSLSPLSQAALQDISVCPVEDQHRLEAGDTVSFQWVVYNNGSSPLLLTLELETTLPSRLSYQLDPYYVVLGPGEGRDVYLNVTADRDMYNLLLQLELGFIIVDMVDGGSVQETYWVTLDVRAFYGELDRENKVLGIWDNFLPSPLDGVWGAFVVSVLLWLLIAYLVLVVLGPRVRRLAERTATRWDDVLVGVLRQPLFLFILLYGAISSLQILKLDPGTVSDLELLYLVGLVLIGALLAYRLLVRMVLCFGRERCQRNGKEGTYSLVSAVEMLGKVVIPVAAIFVFAAMFGLDLTGAILGLGFLGLVIGYATQSTLSNFFAGLQLMVDRPFRVGDRVPLEDGDVAEVRKVGLRMTTFYDLDTNELIMVPNSLIENQVIVNMSAPDIRFKVNVKVRVPLNEDPKKVEELMMEASRLTPQILQGANAPVVRVSEVKDGRMLLTIFIWVDSVYNRHIARTEYRTNLYRLFRENGVEFAYPRMMVWLHRERGEGPQEGA